MDSYKGLLSLGVVASALLSVLAAASSFPGDIFAAVPPPAIITASIDEPIVSVDGHDIQAAHVLLSVPGKISAIKSVVVSINTPDVPNSSVGRFTWSPAGGFVEQIGPTSGSEYVNLLPPNPSSPDTSSRVIFNQTSKQLELIYRWTLNKELGTTVDNDLTISLRTKSATSARADGEFILDANFDTNTPPDAEATVNGEPIDFIDVIGGIEDADVDIVATDVDGDPIESYLLLESPEEGILTDNNFFWDTQTLDVGITENVQVIVFDTFGQTTVDFDVNVIDEPIPETGSWDTVSTTNAPTGRSQHSVVWTGSDVIVWGGNDAGEEFAVGTGAIYNPATDTWTATAAPLNGYAAQAHSAVWTGSEMIVWGGLTSSTSATNEGQLYNPVTDSWRTMSTVGAPSARHSAATVWTGTEMIVWGGATVISGGGVGYLNNGAKYNPVTNTWTSLPASSLTPRQSAGATFSSGRMFVWGGLSWSAETGTVFHNDGGVYEPATDSWASIAAGGPEGRVNHAMASLSSGTFTVWGGQNSSGYLDTGASYDDAFVSWLSTPDEHAPEVRTSMAWGGGEEGVLVVWGGVDANNVPIATGGVFNQATNSWLATSTTGAPTARQLSEGVWTGTGLFVWGGISEGGILENTGGVFTP